MTTYRRVPRAAAVADLRNAPGNDEAPADAPRAAAPEDAEEVSYRDLQARAKEAGIPANQSREDLEAALGGAS